MCLNKLFSKIKLPYIVFIVLLSGCNSTSGLPPKVSASGFDNAKVVDIAPHGNACKQFVCTGLGAQWNGSDPQTAILKVQVSNETVAIFGAALAIEGIKMDLIPSSTPTSLGRYGAGGVNFVVSGKNFIVSINLIRKIVSSNKVWLRVVTANGTFEDAVVDGPTDSKALHALKRFLAKVDQAS